MTNQLEPMASAPKGSPALLAPLLLTFCLLLAAVEASAKRLEFDVFLGDRPIGSHEFVVEQENGETQVSINADFKVKVLFVTAFDYQHQNIETWQNNCLKAIEATTVVNGDTFEVTGKQSADRFELVNKHAAEADCARSFAYWDRSLLPTEGEALPLLNSQTGKFVPATLTTLGSSQLVIGDQTLPVNRYELNGEGVTVTLSYAETAQGREEWVGLSSAVRGGRTLNYVRTPTSLAQATASRE